MSAWAWIGAAFVGLIVGVVVYDLFQTQHAILRAFPVIGHFRYWLESVGPELRQYIVTSNNEERPFSRDQRRWVYASAKRENNYFGFGTDEKIELEPDYVIIKHAAFGPGVHHEQRDAERGVEDLERPPIVADRPEKNVEAPAGAPASRFRYDFPVQDLRPYTLPCAKVLGGHRGREKAFRPESIVGISGMSFGSLSAAAVEAMNRGAKICGCLHNTGEGGISPHHAHGGDLIWQIGTAYFGCREPDGSFSRSRFLEAVDEHPVRAVEIKLSQGAKPGLGGLLPGAKVTPEIARIRGVPEGKDVISPAHHSAFGNVDEMLDFVEDLAEATGLPVGIKSAVGESNMWRDLAHIVATEDRGVDFITIDGGEGGTGAAPLVFADHVALPFRQGFSRVFRIFAEEDAEHKVVWFGSGKLGFPESALLACALGVDMVNVGREAMMAVGCIQAQRCHTGNCPTGVATQNKWLMRGLVPTDKAARLANYVVTLRKELLWLSRACGVEHPGLTTGHHVELLDAAHGSRDLYAAFGYEPGWGLPGAADRHAIRALMEELEREQPLEH
ncbi:MAG: FMN-binding glutamate synthase family protein [Gemmatimonadales bacterium]|jgi:glutamate synthase domain-containing protein 2